MEEVFKAIRWATAAHGYQKRKDSGIPYIAHPISVMRLLSNIGITDTEMLAAAVLHDVVEDTPYELCAVTHVFGERVATLVSELTNPEGLKGYENKKAHLKTFAEEASDEAVLIKACDRICNVEDFVYFGNYSYAKKYALQAMPVFDRAYRLNTEMECVIGALETLLTMEYCELIGGADGE